MITGMQALRSARYFLVVALLLLAPVIAWAGVVTTLADNGNAGSLRAQVANGGTVTFGVTGAILLVNGAIAVPNGVTISGPGANLMEVSGNGAGKIFTVASGATVQISGLTLSAGNAGPGGQGGAIYNLGSLTLTGTTISANSAGDSGGGVYNAGTLTIGSSTFNGNSVGDATCAGGGAIRSEITGSVLKIINSTITANSASNCSGGGISFSDGAATIVSSTVDANSAGLSGGNVYKGNVVAALTLRNTVISAGTTGGGTPTNPDLHGAVGGGLTSLGYNLVQTRGDGTGYAATDLASGTDPLLVALANNSGPTSTQALTSTSPAIDKIPLANCLDLGGSLALATDQRGVSRPQGSGCDIGAFEARQSAFNVSVVGAGAVSAGASPAPISGSISVCGSSGGSNCGAVYLGDPAAQVILTATPSIGFTFSGWTGDCSGGGTCSLMTDQPHNVEATFTINTFAVTLNSAANGTIVLATPVGTNLTSVPFNTVLTFAVTPSNGYSASVTGCGGTLTGNTYTTAQITAACAVTPTFTINTYTLTYTAGVHGTIMGTTAQTVNSGGSGTPVTAVPNAGYHFAQWSDASTSNPRTDTNVTASISVTATFAVSTLVFTTQPANVMQGQDLATVVVMEEDGGGNTIIDNSSRVDFTIAACGGSLDLGSVTMVNGVAILNVSRVLYTVENGLTIQASDGLSTATSGSFDVTPNPDSVFADGFESCRL